MECTEEWNGQWSSVDRRMMWIREWSVRKNGMDNGIVFGKFCGRGNVVHRKMAWTVE